MKNEQLRTKPAAEIRLGSIRAAIWRNEGKTKPWFTVTLERSYRDDDDQYQSSNSFGRDDLLTAAKVVDLAHTRIFELQREELQRELQQSEESSEV
jgi:hypothetical protein